MHFGGTLPRPRRRRRNRGSRRRRRAWTTSRGRRAPDPSVEERLLRALRSSSPRRGTRGSGPNPNRDQNLIPGPSPLARGRRPRRRRDRRRRERARLTSGVWCLGPRPPRWTPRHRRRGWDRPRRGPRPGRCPGDDRRADRSRRSRRDSTTVNRRPRLRPRPRRSPPARVQPGWSSSADGLDAASGRPARRRGVPFLSSRMGHEAMGSTAMTTRSPSMVLFWAGKPSSLTSWGTPSRETYASQRRWGLTRIFPTWSSPRRSPRSTASRDQNSSNR